MAFYYYLTRDDSVLQDILKIKDYIFSNYYNSSLGTLQWQLQDGGGSLAASKRLVADLDQMNTYLVLLTPILPDTYQTQWKQTLRQEVRSILGIFYSPSDNLFFLQADNPQQRNLEFAGVDVGHSSKSLWMLRWTALMTGDQSLAVFAEANARRLLDRAYIPEADGSGSWAGGVSQGGALDKNKSWWVYDELDQLSASLALADIDAGRYLPQTNEYWFKYFVDTQFGEVWNGVNYADHSPQRDFPKAWQWKSAYHDTEHVLVGYLTSQWLHGSPATLYYAFGKAVDPASVHPYYFPVPAGATTTTRDSAGNTYQAVTFPPPVIGTAATVRLTSAASGLAGPLAAGALASAWGSQLPATSSGTTVTLTDFAGASWPADVSYASTSQVNFRVPPGAAPGPATLKIASGAGVTVTPAQIARVAPGLFQMNTTALAAAIVVRVRADQSQSIENVYQVGPGNTVRPLPIDLATESVYLTLFATGLQNAQTVQVTIGGYSVPVLYSGPQGTYAGLDQVNAGPVPRTLSGGGPVTIVLTADDQTANPVEVTIK